MKHSQLPILALILAASLGNVIAQTSLKDAYKDAFLIGAAVNQRQFTGVDTRGAGIIKANALRDFGFTVSKELEVERAFD